MDMNNTVWPQMVDAFRTSTNWVGYHYAHLSPQTQQWTLFGLAALAALIVLGKTTDNMPVLRNPLVRLLAAGAVGVWASGHAPEVRRWLNSSVETPSESAQPMTLAVVPVTRGGGPRPG